MSSDRIRLGLIGLPKLVSISDLSDAIRLSKGLLFRCAKYPNKQYYTYTIPKKTGGTRVISQPSAELKAVQGWILRTILDRLSVSPACKGFVPGASTRDNATPHIGAKAIMCLDIQDFFPNVKASHVYSLYRTIGYSTQVASILTSLCTFHGGLPQGAPTSPALANLTCVRFDARILGYVGKRGIVYTRYADDLTFSAYSYSSLPRALPMITKIIESEGFLVNRQKTRIRGPARRHTVTGLVVTQNNVGVGRKTYRELRAKLHRLATMPIKAVKRKEIAKVKGSMAYLNSVDKVRRDRLDDYLIHLKMNYPKSILTKM
ncbi:MAG: retron St85 family RNA-directed DNA polymerase [Candidatus Eisenbacteria bacterium]|uniref:RNA-directed DNA polymerase n=1 Tax=Eiseniibacteriota bacterium TaxID=2212470 RepID=A0A948W7T6_UNCEI|nr:retron St85 family RNA-directed DNA polymerase [Candidatus Eisenbacteria bacterium]MBU1949553.1 retron St85 family RNA-directed DNA polymerase [Candidatus Eisenbacteria bacterium]MBU2691991.1 retron St85 family RNA-directed DNA polymerase [Candidatus Eisenbacteria bacterium]